MLKAELEELVALRTPGVAPLLGRELQNRSPRTLLYGVTREAFTHHVYLDEQQCIRVHVYGACRGSHRPARWLALGESDGPLCDLDYLPKRLQPQYCDAEFCRRLQARKLVLPFAPWEAPQPNRHPYAGERIEASAGCDLRFLGRWGFAQLRQVVATLSAQAIRFCDNEAGAVYVVGNDLNAAEHALGMMPVAA